MRAYQSTGQSWSRIDATLQNSHPRMILLLMIKILHHLIYAFMYDSTRISMGSVLKIYLGSCRISIGFTAGASENMVLVLSTLGWLMPATVAMIPGPGLCPIDMGLSETTHLLITYTLHDLVYQHPGNYGNMAQMGSGRTRIISSKA